MSQPLLQVWLCIESETCAHQEVCRIKVDKRRRNQENLLHTVFTPKSAAVLIQFFAPQVQRLFERGAYSRRHLFKHLTRQIYFF